MYYNNVERPPKSIRATIERDLALLRQYEPHQIEARIALECIQQEQKEYEQALQQQTQRP